MNQVKRSISNQPTRHNSDFLEQLKGYFIERDEHRKIIYDRKSRLGSGAFGAVFKGTFNGKPVAVKRVTLFDDKTFEDREANALITKLIHPNIVRLLHTEYDSYFKYYALELYAGPLDKCLLPSGKNDLSLPRHIKILFQLTIGLDYIHFNGFVHRDIKPENILISVA